MGNNQAPAYGTMLIAALLLLTLAFAGTWILDYVASGGRPWGLLPWFVGGAVVIIVLAFVIFLFRYRSRGANNQ